MDCYNFLNFNNIFKYFIYKDEHKFCFGRNAPSQKIIPN